MRKLAVLGSTGSIGRQTLDVVSCYPDRFRVWSLTAHSSAQALFEQVRAFRPERAGLVCQPEALPEDVEFCSWRFGGDCSDWALEGADDALGAVVGIAGLPSALRALDVCERLLLANKEALVTGGHLVMEKARRLGKAILPVDSEHSAIFQCLQARGNNPVKKLILTASGGPFRTWSMEQLQHATREQALKHPNWDMGAKITIDSASMMNKGFEVIEAKWLFDVTPEQIEVVVHPQSVIHSMVQFADGSVKAQLGTPDMRLPIQYAFSYPQRLSLSSQRLDFSTLSSLTFEQPDPVRFRNLDLSFEALERGGNMPCILNAANEVCVAAFLKERIGFLQMSDVIEQTMQRTSFITSPTYDDYVATDAAARRIAEELITHNS